MDRDSYDKIIDLAKRVRLARTGGMKQHIRIEVACKTKMMIMRRIRLTLDFLSHVFGSSMVAMSVVGTAHKLLHSGDWDVLLAACTANCCCYDPVNGSHAMARANVKVVCKHPVFCVTLIWYAYKMVYAADDGTGDGPSHAVVNLLCHHFKASKSKVVEYIPKFERHALRLPQQHERPAGDGT